MRSSALIIALILLFLVSAVVAQENEAKQPSIYIKNLMQDIGNVFEQDSYKFTFVVQNSGTADLVIESVKPG